MAAEEQVSPIDRPARAFATTRWSVVLQASDPTSNDSGDALEQLCRTYWYPLYFFARRTGVPPHDAEDLTQSFFAYLLEKDVIARVDRERGRFRNFLLAAFKNFHASQRAHRTAAKRGGGKAIISLDELKAENRYEHEPRTHLSPEILFDQKWAASLFEQVMQDLRSEYVKLGKGALFEVLRGAIWGGRQEISYARLARESNLSEGAFKVAVHRLRLRYKEALRSAVAQTVATPEEIDDELRQLLAAVTL